MFLGHVARSNCNCHGPYRHIKVNFLRLFRFVSLCKHIYSGVIYLYLLQSTWHISPLGSGWCVNYSKLSAARFPSSWRARGRKSHIRALFPRVYECQHEVRCGWSSMSIYVMWWFTSRYSQFCQQNWSLSFFFFFFDRKIGLFLYLDINILNSTIVDLLYSFRF